MNVAQGQDELKKDDTKLVDFDTNSRNTHKSRRNRRGRVIKRHNLKPSIAKANAMARKRQNQFKESSVPIEITTANEVYEMVDNTVLIKTYSTTSKIDNYFCQFKLSPLASLKEHNHPTIRFNCGVSASGSMLHSQVASATKKFYYEVIKQCNSAVWIGICTDEMEIDCDAGTFVGADEHGWGMLIAGRNSNQITIFHNGEASTYFDLNALDSDQNDLEPSYDVFGVCLNLEDNVIEFYKNRRKLGIAFNSMVSDKNVQKVGGDIEETVFYPCITLKYDEKYGPAKLVMNLDGKYFNSPVPRGYQTFGAKKLLQKFSHKFDFISNQPAPLSQFLALNGLENDFISEIVPKSGKESNEDENETSDGSEYKNIFFYLIDLEFISMIKYLFDIFKHEYVLNMINRKSSSNGDTPFHHLCRCQETSDSLIVFGLFMGFAGCDLNVKNASGHTPIHYIIQNNNIEMLKSLLKNENGKQININVMHCLWYAISNNSLKCVEILLNTANRKDPKQHKGQNIDIINFRIKRKYNALQYSVVNGYKFDDARIFVLLLKALFKKYSIDESNIGDFQKILDDCVKVLKDKHGKLDGQNMIVLTLGNIKSLLDSNDIVTFSKLYT